MDFNEIERKSYNKYTFGKCLRQQRQEAGYSVRQLSSEVGISAVYLSDIENGNRYAPMNNKNGVLEKIIVKLNIPEEQLEAFYDMAIASKGYHVFKDYLEQENNVVLFLDYAQKLGLSNDEWNVIFNQLEEFGKKRSSNNKVKVKVKRCD